MSDVFAMIPVERTSPSSGRRSIWFRDCVTDWAGLWAASLFGVYFVGGGGFVCTLFVYSSSRLAFMWLSNIWMASFNRAFTFSVTLCVHASIAASIFPSKRVSTVSSSDASPVVSRLLGPSCRVLFCSWSVVIFSSSSYILSSISLYITVPSRYVYAPVYAMWCVFIKVSSSLSRSSCKLVMHTPCVVCCSLWWSAILLIAATQLVSSAW